VHDLPKTYVRLLQDQAVPLAEQDEMIRRLGQGVSAYDIDAGHEVMITTPRQLAAVLAPILIEADRPH
jgi:hypothetical protein